MKPGRKRVSGPPYGRRRAERRTPLRRLMKPSCSSLPACASATSGTRRWLGGRSVDSGATRERASGRCGASRASQERVRSSTFPCGGAVLT